MRPAFNSSPTSPLTNSLKTVGFCVDIDGEDALTDAGVPIVWRRGNGDESLDWAIASFRDQPGILKITDSLLIFGEGRNEILARLSELVRKKIALVDIRDPDATVHDLEAEALRSLSASNGMKDRRTAKKRGRMGGHAKAIAAQSVRQSIAADWFLQNLAGLVPVHIIVSASENKLTASSFRRHYIKTK